MSPFLPRALRDTVLDLRTRHTEADRMRPWVRRLYQALLVAVVVSGVVALGLETAALFVPTDYGFTLGTSRRGVVVSMTDRTDVDLLPRDRVLAIQHVPLDSSAIRTFEGSPDSTAAARARTILAQRRSGDVTLTVSRSAGEGTRATHEVTVTPRPSRWWTTALDELTTSLVILIGGLGLLALQARATTPAVSRFVHLCLAAGIPLAGQAWVSDAATLWAPLPRVLSSSPLLPAAVSAVWAVAFGFTLLRLLHAFPTDEPRFREAYPLPVPGGPTRWAVGTFAVAWLAARVASPFLGPFWRDIVTDLGTVAAEFLVVVLVIVAARVVIRLTERIFHLSRLRVQEADPRSEEGQQARLALLGIRWGALFCLLTIFAVLFGMAMDGLSHSAGSVPAPMDTADLVFLALVYVLLVMSVGPPFLGIGLAVTRRRLWDVDLMAQRATLFSILGVLFFLLWIGIDQGLGAVLPTGSVPGLGPLLAGTGVAVTQGPLSRALTRWFFPRAVDVGDALEAVSARLVAPDASSSSPERVGHALAEELGCERAAVFTRGPGGELSIAWQACGDAPLPDVGAALAPALSERTTVTARTDDGPVLAVRVGPPNSFRAAVVLGPRSGGRFYSSQDRRMLTLLLAPLGPVLAPNP